MSADKNASFINLLLSLFISYYCPLLPSRARAAAKCFVTEKIDPYILAPKRVINDWAEFRYEMINTEFEQYDYF